MASLHGDPMAIDETVAALAMKVVSKDRNAAVRIFLQMPFRGCAAITGWTEYRYAQKVDSRVQKKARHLA